MNIYTKQKGFTLAEVLIAAAILAVGLAMIAMTFPAGIRLAGMAAERTIAAAAFDEALAKIKLYGVKPPADPVWAVAGTQDYTGVAAVAIPDSERFYPSVAAAAEKRYHWSAIIRKTGENQVQATVFVCRMAADGLRYYTPTPGTYAAVPTPVRATVSKVSGANKNLMVVNAANAVFAPGAAIVENIAGQICIVEKTEDLNGDGVPDVVILQDDYNDKGQEYVWVIPPAVGSKRNPCIAVYQQTMTF